MTTDDAVFVSGESSAFIQEVRLGQHRIIADEPVAKGGTDAGPGPYPLLLAALGSCTSMTVSMYARHKNWPLKSVNVQLRHSKIKGERDHIDREIQLIGDLSEEQHARLLDIANKCPVHKTLSSSVEIETKLM